jgi:hypothetical protein
MNRLYPERLIYTNARILCRINKLMDDRSDVTQINIFRLLTMRSIIAILSASFLMNSLSHQSNPSISFTGLCIVNGRFHSDPGNLTETQSRA